MTRWVALLRGIAPMHANQKNEQLRGVCEHLGFRNVTSVLSSGNLVFDADTRSAARVEAMLEAAWPEQLGFVSASIVRSCRQIAALVESAPFGDRTHGKQTYLLATFAKKPAVLDIPEPELPPDAAFEVVGRTDRELFTVTNTEGHTPDVMAWLETSYGTDITSRTWLTVQRILARC